MSAVQLDGVNAPVYKRALGALGALHRAGFSAIVAGGVMRDLRIGRVPKDIDVFIPMASKGTLVLASALAAALGDYVDLDCDLSYSEDSEVARVFSVHDDKTPTLQIIETTAEDLDALIARCSRHDFGAVQAWMGVDGVPRFTDAFAHDLENKCFTLTHCESAKEHARSMRRYSRWALDPILSQFRLVDNTPWASTL